MSFEHYIRSGKKQLRCGYTTGTCAAIAASAAAEYLLSGTAPSVMSVITPKGWKVETEILEPKLTDGAASCSVRKDAGDDSDVTDSLIISASVRFAAGNISIDGGTGVGRVTRPGLDQPPGSAAINSGPRRQIAAAVEEVCAEHGYAGGMEIIISVPEGETAARKTFNPMLGIEGGISILGTSGIVEPMSEQALVDTIELEISQAAASGTHRLILTPGNYGLDYLRSELPQLDGIACVKCSNFIGDALDIAYSRQFSEVLLVGHVGKLVKLAAGVMNTHSKTADCRKEIFCAHAAVNGAGRDICLELMQQVSTDGCIAVLDRCRMREPVMEDIMTEIEKQLRRRAGDMMLTGAVLFSNEHGLLGITEDAEELLDRWQKESCR